MSISQMILIIQSIFIFVYERGMASETNTHIKFIITAKFDKTGVLGMILFEV